MDAQALTADAEPGWGPVRRFVFRFLFVYLVLYLLPFPLNGSPGVDAIGVACDRFWLAIDAWVGPHVLRVNLPPYVENNGSGDTTHNYVQVFVIAVIAAAAAVTWTLAERRSRRHDRLYAGLRLYVRYALAATMITYGASKVVQLQFPPPSLDRLTEQVGDASPMGMLWTFMGSSRAYNVFCGLGEIVGGLLLTTRRTTLLGALLCVAVLGHVVVLNFSYDVPVKVFSTHLLAMAIFLAAPDLRRLADVFLLNRRAEPAEIRPLFQRRWLNRAALVLRTAVVAAYAVAGLVAAEQFRRQAYDRAQHAPLRGIWNVEAFSVDGPDGPPAVTHGTRWRRLVAPYPGYVRLQVGEAQQMYGLKLDPAKGSFVLKKRSDPSWESALAYSQPEPDALVLDGPFDGKTVHARLRRADERQFLLLSRGFHWVNEVPFNR